MVLGSLDGRENSEHNGVGFEEISEIFQMPCAFFFGSESLDRI